MQVIDQLTSTVAPAVLPKAQVDEYYLESTREDILKNLRNIFDNPYPGIRPFKKSESSVLFGRRAITEALVAKLAERRFVTVLGSSGSGKSSLVRAGLIPVLETLPGINGKWKVAICRPGKNPFGNLAMAIERSGIMPHLQVQEIYDMLSGSSFGYHEMYTGYDKPRQYNALIIIDQFEELFRYRSENGTTGRSDASLFVKMLLEISNSAALQSYVIITMRSEYIGDCVQIPQLVEEINKGQFLVPLLDTGQLKHAVTQPALVANAAIEPLLVERIIGEAVTYNDYLPILQHALRRAFQHAKMRTLKDVALIVTYEDYRAIGGMDAAIDLHAGEILKSFNPLEVAVCEILFKTITDRTTDSRGIRRPTSFAVIESVCYEFLCPQYAAQLVTGALRNVIDRFRGESVNFLMPPPHVMIDQDTEIDISHESLMRIWADLSRWMERESKDVLLLKELGMRSQEQLLEGASLLTYETWQPYLKNAVNWAKRYNVAALPEELFVSIFYKGNTVIAESIRYKKDAEAKAEKAQLELLEEQQRKARKRLVWLFITAIALAAVTGLVLIFANLNGELEQAKKANEAQIAALDTAKNNLINTNNRLTQSEKDLQQSLDKENKAKIRESEKNDSLTRIKESLKQKNDSLELQTKVAEVARKAEKAAKEEVETTIEKLKSSYSTLEELNNKSQQLQNLALALKHAQKSLAIPVYDLQRKNVKQQLALLSYKYLMHSGKAEQLRLQPEVFLSLYNALSKTEAGRKLDIQANPYRFGEDRVGVASLTTQPANSPKAFLSAEHSGIWSWDLEKNTVNRMPLNTALTLVSVQVSPTGNWLATNGLDSLLLYQLQHLQLIRVPLKKSVRCYKFSPDGKYLFAATTDNLLHKIDLSAPGDTLKIKNVKMTAPVEALSVSDHFVYGVTGGAAVFKIAKDHFEAANVSLITPPVMDKARVFRGTAISCSRDDSLLVWGNEHGEVFYVQQGGTAGRNLTAFGGPVTAIAFNRSATYLAIASFDKSVKIFSLPSPQAQAPIHIRNNEGPVTSLFFMNDPGNTANEQLTAFVSPGVLRIFPLDLRALACKLEQQAADVLTAEEIKLYFDEQVLPQLNERVCK